MNTQNHQFAEHTAITASVVPDELRIGFWPQHFGSIPQWITLEPRIFAWMDRLCADYHGGIWNFSTLSKYLSVKVAGVGFFDGSCKRSQRCLTSGSSRRPARRFAPPRPRLILVVMRRERRYA